MQTFDQAITTEWVEVLQGAVSVVFDVIGATQVRVYFTEGTTPDPSERGNQVLTYPTDWDFSAMNMVSPQMIWIRTLEGENRITGVR